MVFERHKTEKGKAFLPIILRHHFNSTTNTLRLTVIYMDVTAVTTKNDKGYFVCNLAGSGHLDLETA
jgi:hypothetical protein